MLSFIILLHYYDADISLLSSRHAGDDYILIIDVACWDATPFSLLSFHTFLSPFIYVILIYFSFISRFHFADCARADVFIFSPRHIIFDMMRYLSFVSSLSATPTYFAAFDDFFLFIISILFIAAFASLLILLPVCAFAILRFDMRTMMIDISRVSLPIKIDAVSPSFSILRYIFSFIAIVTPCHTFHFRYDIFPLSFSSDTFRRRFSTSYRYAWDTFSSASMTLSLRLYRCFHTDMIAFASRHIFIIRFHARYFRYWLIAHDISSSRSRHAALSFLRFSLDIVYSLRSVDICWCIARRHLFLLFISFFDILMPVFQFSFRYLRFFHIYCDDSIFSYIYCSALMFLSPPIWFSATIFLSSPVIFALFQSYISAILIYRFLFFFFRYFPSYVISFRSFRWLIFAIVFLFFFFLDFLIYTDFFSFLLFQRYYAFLLLRYTSIAPRQTCRW